ncbi:MAG: hypothetical protein ACM3XO_14105 [Bacteroidota bacterium]
MDIPFDGILTLLIFLVGIPAIILQLISAAERRAVINREDLDVKKFLRNALFVIIFVLILQFVRMFLFSSLQDALKNFVEQIIWLILFGSLFYFVMKVSKQIPEQYGRRERIIEKLKQEVINDVIQKSRIEGGSFRDLASLGKQCEPGQEREMVVDAFKDIVKATLKTPEYNGDSFEPLINEIVHMLASNPEPRDLENYNSAIKLLSEIMSVKVPSETDNDKQRAVHAVSELGRTLIIHFKSVERDNIILDYTDSLELALLTSRKMLTEVSQALFEIGICAVDEKQDIVVVASLDKLTTLAECYPPLSNEFVADMLGLLAHFRAMEGSREEFSWTKFREVKEYLPDDLLLSLENASNHCQRTMYFDVADELSQMAEILQNQAGAC